MRRAHVMLLVPLEQQRAALRLLLVPRQVLPRVQDRPDHLRRRQETRQLHRTSLGLHISEQRLFSERPAEKKNSSSYAFETAASRLTSSDQFPARRGLAG